MCRRATKDVCRLWRGMGNCTQVVGLCEKAIGRHLGARYLSYREGLVFWCWGCMRRNHVTLRTFAQVGGPLLLAVFSESVGYSVQYLASPVVHP
jgi:hypothetical protein